ncbi:MULTISPECIES: MarR family transcriptional regulator [Veillonella]|uniref:MarR family winged helix-turn-helix transcriptional regulator n=2 Tax=Veillonellaceae TaxID=31977 RepID=UPI000F8C90EA|nr:MULTISPECIES: MarR family transcriptional regulator [Veillonella]MCB5743410.1 MarR family transcriptional regulator [Veillonella ratti]MCB5759688.1 MarR family transcriptional regulator [Veillonella ratti]MCB5761984.1 MarR family transcriptional regulator [Veillonella ratti]MCC2750217.1 MarR family transcriptional regulator [Veillonella ratti]MCK0528785.1 MarR family transcriptional regulator [Veillonella sp. KGMB01456]
MKSLEMRALVGLHRSVNMLDKLTADLAAKYEVTFSQFMVLEALYSKGDLTVGAVREHILSSVGTISVIVNNLVKMKYIERLTDKNDRRVSILHLTEAGHKIISQLAPENITMIKDVLSVLDEKEKEDLVAILRKIGGKTDEKNR